MVLVRTVPLLAVFVACLAAAAPALAGVSGGYTKPSGVSEALTRCAPRPATYEGTDETVAALTYLEQELADECDRKFVMDTEQLTTADNIENEVHSLVVELKAWGTGLPSFKSEQTVACSNCSGGGGGGGGEVELAAPSKAVVEQAPMSATAYLIGALVGFMFFGVVYLFLRSKT
jgi:hypothetical protein